MKFYENQTIQQFAAQKNKRLVYDFFCTWWPTIIAGSIWLVFLIWHSLHGTPHPVSVPDDPMPGTIERWHPEAAPEIPLRKI